MSKAVMNKEEAQAVKRLRAENSDLLTPKCGTDFNLLRWAQGYGFDMEEASAQLRRHLKFRKFYDLDNYEKIPEHPILKQYFPIGLVGKTGQDNTLLVIECAGRIDLVGILKSVQLSDFLIQRFRFQESMLAALNEMEAETGKQASVIYILDLDGLKFDTSLLSIVTGPYRILWASVYTNYPEWIKRFYMVNAPPFMGLVWKAIGPLLPERTRNKVHICTTNSDWKNQIQKVAKPENVPAHWGGTLYDANGDGMCRDRLNIPFDPIPRELYWEPDERAPAPNWFPDFDYPGMPTVDYLRIKTLGAGVYKVKYGNEQAWVRSLTIYYRIRFEKENGDLADFKELK
ncbi:CRAL-TRIO domain-containing protein [Trichostrongylus colubriformis]|uniref:CRAL-TRIO domain-containing protein n=1 Tax=Trichostrongylus colubriformis TaxID=6319 RepID=A0AAN8FZT6_TRICO